jgi:hypothetical protein
MVSVSRYNPLIKATETNLDRKLAELVLEKTTRTEERKLLDPPVDITGRRMFDGLTFTLEVNIMRTIRSICVRQRLYDQFVASAHCSEHRMAG